jgi:hypothetical protein
LAETGEEATSRKVLIDDLMHGQYGNPARIVAFNTRDAWSRDVTKDIACELRRRLVEYADVPVSVQAFVEPRARRGRCEKYRSMRRGD